MTIEESKYYVKLNFDGMMENPRVILDPKYIEAERMAIKSLEAWDEITQEINDLFSKPACYMPNYDAYKMFLEIIDKHLKEVQNNDK